jgi:putative SOS response-associated peptidase YedK
MKPIRDRMPVILDEDDWPLWLGEVEGDPANLLPQRKDPGADDLTGQPPSEFPCQQ